MKLTRIIFLGLYFIYSHYNGNAQVSSTNNVLATTGVTAIQSITSSYKLSVGGAVKQFGTGTTGAGSPTLYLRNTTATTGRNFGINSGDAGLFQVFDSNASNAIRLAINSAGKVGIGTTSPSEQLSIAGSSGNIFLGSTLSGTSYNGLWLNGSTTANDYNLLSNSADQNLYINRPSGKKILFSEFDVDQVSIAAGGNFGIGIGTSGAATKVEINATGSSDGILLRNNTSGFVRMFPSTLTSGSYNPLTQAGDGGFIYGTALQASGTNSTFGLVLAPWHHSAVGLRMDVNGNIGINKATPTAPLDVNGNIKTTGLILTTSAGVGKVLGSDASGNATWQLPSALFSGWSLAGNSGTTPATQFIGTTDNQSFVLRTNNTEAFRITTSGSLIGGTASPTANAIIVIRQADSTQRLFFGHGQSSNLNLYGTDVGDGADNRGGADLTLTYTKFANAAFRVYTTDNTTYTKRLGVTQGGFDANITDSFSIGVNSGVYKLRNLPSTSDTAFKITVFNPATKELKYVNSWQSTPSSANTWSVTGNTGINPSSAFIGTTDNQPLLFKTNNVENVRLTGAGNLLIGSTTDDGSNKLQVNGASKITGNLFVSGTTTLGDVSPNSPAQHVINYSNNTQTYNGKGLKIVETTNNSIARLHSFQNGLYVTNDAGDPGKFSMGSIGNPWDNSEFRIGYNRWEIRSGALTLNQDWAGIGQFEMTIGAADRKGIIIKAASSQTANIQEWQNSTGTSLVTINASGSMGIGTTSISDANYKLFVLGSIRARKVRVDNDTWPDYVFDNDYRLPTLAEVQEYINQHHHLPNVPSSIEVEKNGTDLGENQALLLKKIEELTLYAINQNKQIESQGKQIESQDKKLEQLQQQIDELKRLSKKN